MDMTIYDTLLLCLFYLFYFNLLQEEKGQIFRSGNPFWNKKDGKIEYLRCDLFIKFFYILFTLIQKHLKWRESAKYQFFI